MKILTLAAALGLTLFATHLNAQEKIEMEASKILIAVYSWGGNTKLVADQLRAATGADLYEIKPATAYPTDYQATVDQAKKEIADGVKPALQNKPENLDKYDVIFIGSPNWWSTIAPPVATFLSSYDLEGKTIVPFITHGGGGLARCESDIRKLCAKSKVLPSLTLSGNRVKNSAPQVEKWVNDTFVIKK